MSGMGVWGDGEGVEGSSGKECNGRGTIPVIIKCP